MKQEKPCVVFLSLLVALSALPAPALAQATENVAHQQYLGLVADPGNMVRGSAFYRSDLDKLRFRVGTVQSWDGSAWVDITLFGDKSCNSGTTTFTVSANSNNHACLLIRAAKSDAADLAFSTYHDLHLYFNAKAGGKYDSTSKVSYGPLRLDLDGRTRGQHALIGGLVFGYGIGDALFLGGSVWGYGAKNVTGTSQPSAQFAEINVKQGATIFTAEVCGPLFGCTDPPLAATLIPYRAEANESVLGERALINVSKTTIAGTVTGISGTDVTFSGAPDWTLASPSPVGQYFKIDADDVTLGGVSTGHWHRVTAVVSATVLRLEASWDVDLTTSGAYTLAQGAEISSFDTTANSLTIEANGYDWAEGDLLRSPPMPLVNFRGLNLLLTKEFKTGTSRGLNLANSGPMPWEQGILIEGTPASGQDGFGTGLMMIGKKSTGISFGSAGQSSIVTGIDFSGATISGDALNLANLQKITWAGVSSLSWNGGIPAMTLNRGIQITSASAAIQPLSLRHAASPTVDYLLVRNSDGAHVFKIDPSNKLILQQSFGSGLTLDPATGGLPTVKATGNNTDLVLDLISKGISAVRVNAQASTGIGGLEVWDGAGTPSRVFRVSSSGLAADDRGFKHKRISTASIAAGGSAAVTLTWTTAFADANYTASCSLVEATASTATLRIHHIEAVAAGSVLVRVVNDDGAAAHTGILHCTAVHD